MAVSATSKTVCTCDKRIFSVFACFSTRNFCSSFSRSDIAKRVDVDIKAFTVLFNSFFVLNSSFACSEVIDFNSLNIR